MTNKNKNKNNQITAANIARFANMATAKSRNTKTDMRRAFDDAVKAIQLDDRLFELHYIFGEDLDEKALYLNKVGFKINAINKVEKWIRVSGRVA